MDTLLQIIESLEPVEVANLSAIRITIEEGRAFATLSISRMMPMGTAPARVGPYQISVDTEDMPQGVSLTGLTGYPDICREVTMATPVQDQLEALQTSDIVGGLDATRFQDGAYISWIIKTHAGSDEERRAWATR